MTQPEVGCFFTTNVTNVPTAGTRVQISTSPDKVRRITFKALAGNTGDVYIGGSDVSSSVGFTLGPGESIPLDFDPQTEPLSSFYVDAANNDDKVSWIIGASSVAGQVAGTHTFDSHNGTVTLTDIDLDGATDIGAALVDADLIFIDDGAGGTNRKSTMSRVKTYVATEATKADMEDEGTTNPDRFVSPEVAGDAPSAIKAHGKLDSGAVLTGDNLNLDAGTDDGVGNHQYNFTEDFSTNVYGATVTMIAGAARSVTFASVAVGAINVLSWDQAGNAIDGDKLGFFCGDQ